jgi:hypothetical protein
MQTGRTGWTRNSGPAISVESTTAQASIRKCTQTPGPSSFVRSVALTSPTSLRGLMTQDRWASYARRMSDGRLNVERDDHVPLEPLPHGHRPPPGGNPPAPPGTEDSGRPDQPARSPFEALMYTAKWRGYLYKSELMALTELLDEQADAGLLRTLVGTPRRRRKAVKGMSRRLREMGIAVRRG